VLQSLCGNNASTSTTQAVGGLSPREVEAPHFQSRETSLATHEGFQLGIPTLTYDLPRGLRPFNRRTYNL
jgi:hypothetical protein